ncbi:hypothetical protein JG688_00016476 [Phytophthora aleatoria]|uniref:DDE-1 domain-containing protein n=1 Tax=Phytophthora aleatoria TaxID=2496075 RepID=A0A8J5MCU5_9STRA|nr:hypothetical protein JG688_00016476 [Phytophthora aleatoria]
MFYRRSLLYWHISEPLVLLVVNLDCHVSAESEEVIADEMLTILQPLSNLSTSVCQPLDIGVMGSFKVKLRELWMLERPPPLRNGGEKRPRRPPSTSTWRPSSERQRRGNPSSQRQLRKLLTKRFLLNFSKIQLPPYFAIIP